MSINKRKKASFRRRPARPKRKRLETKTSVTNVIYKPQMTRFKTDAERLFEQIGENFDAVKEDQVALEKAYRWRRNYVNAMEREMIPGISDVNGQEDLLDDLIVTENRIMNSDITVFLEAMYEHPEELSISSVYDVYNRILTGIRFVELWSTYL